MKLSHKVWLYGFTTFFSSVASPLFLILLNASIAGTTDIIESIHDLMTGVIFAGGFFLVMTILFGLPASLLIEWLVERRGMWGVMCKALFHALAGAVIIVLLYVLQGGVDGSAVILMFIASVHGAIFYAVLLAIRRILA